jgi:tetratricopeptide (TPR) repeat protein
VAKYKKKRVRELQHDRFRDTTIGLVDRVGNKLEGKGKTILYGLGGLIVIAFLVGFGVRWSNKKADEARKALGRAITISTTSISTPGAPNPSGPTFSSEQERAQQAVSEFQKVMDKYGDPYHTEARFLRATNLLRVDRTQGINELTQLTQGSNPEVAILSKFALAQAYESDGKLDEAAKLYNELAQQNNPMVTAETANLRLGMVYAKQGKRKEAADLFFNIVEASRKAKDDDGSPLTPSAASRSATEELQKLDPDRYAKLSPEAPPGEAF